MDLVAQAAAGLDAAHRAGLVHRDIKPANLLIGPGGRVKITDFGIAHAAGSASFTCTGMLVGTAAYLAPERVVGDMAGPASDLYALGIVGYECLAGAPPFGGMPVEVALAHRDRPLPPLPGSVPADVAALVADLTAKDPAVRPAPASQVALRAGLLRDAMTAGRVIHLRSRPDQSCGTLAGALPHLPPVAAMPARRPVPARRPGTARSRRSMRAVAPVLAAALAVGLLGVLLAGMSGSVLLHQAARPPAHSSAVSPSAAGIAEVDGGSLAGQPVSTVRQQLRQLGLVVRVLWRPSDRFSPGTVVSVYPAGWVPVGSAVIVTGALPHSGHAGHRLHPHRTR
jgi:serine/threonine-protein kinase